MTSKSPRGFKYSIIHLWQNKMAFKPMLLILLITKMKASTKKPLNLKRIPGRFVCYWCTGSHQHFAKNQRLPQLRSPPQGPLPVLPASSSTQTTMMSLRVTTFSFPFFTVLPPVNLLLHEIMLPLLVLELQIDAIRLLVLPCDLPLVWTIHQALVQFHYYTVFHSRSVPQT